MYLELYHLYIQTQISNDRTAFARIFCFRLNLKKPLQSLHINIPEVVHYGTRGFGVMATDLRKPGRMDHSPSRWPLIENFLPAWAPLVGPVQVGKARGDPPPPLQTQHVSLLDSELVSG